MAVTTTLVTGISATGALVTGATNPGRLFVQNVGTVPVSVYYTADGSGSPVAQLVGGTANDDGNGAVLSDTVWDMWNGVLWLKAPATGGRALVGML